MMTTEWSPRILETDPVCAPEFLRGDTESDKGEFSDRTCSLS